MYLHGLLLDGERKSIEPLSRRVPGGNEQSLQQFIDQSPSNGPDPGIATATRDGMVTAFLAKPFDVEDLVAEVQTAVAQPSNEARDDQDEARVNHG